MSTEINNYIKDEVFRLIVEGVDEDSFATLKAEVMDMGASAIIDELNEWQATK